MVDDLFCPFSRIHTGFSVAQVKTRCTFTGMHFIHVTKHIDIDINHVDNYWPALLQVCCVIEKLKELGLVRLKNRFRNPSATGTSD